MVEVDSLMIITCYTSKKLMNDDFILRVWDSLDFESVGNPGSSTDSLYILNSLILSDHPSNIKLLISKKSSFFVTSPFSSPLTISNLSLCRTQ